MFLSEKTFLSLKFFKKKLVFENLFNHKKLYKILFIVFILLD
jgi:hypothetical protein